MAARLFQAALRQPTHELRILSYNVLANKYAIGGSHQYCPTEYLTWSYRWKKIHAELLQHSPDILCLQEVSRALQEGALSSWGQKNGYTHSGLFLCRGSKSIEDEGIALWYKSDVFTTLDTHVARYADCIKGFSKASFPFLDKAQRCREGCLMALLRHNPSGRLLLAVCTHLFWDPVWPDVKVLQAHLMCDQVASFLSKSESKGLLGGQRHSDVAVVIGGDFNSLWRDSTVPLKAGGVGGPSGVYQLLASGTLGTTHIHHPLNSPTRPPANPKEADQLEKVSFSSAGLRLSSAYLQAWGYEPPVTNCTANFRGVLDYVWLSPAHSKVVEVLPMPYEHSPSTAAADVALGPQPSVDWPSDHLAVGCTIQLLKSGLEQE